MKKENDTAVIHRSFHLPPLFSIDRPGSFFPPLLNASPAHTTHTSVRLFLLLPPALSLSFFLPSSPNLDLSISSFRPFLNSVFCFYSVSHIFPFQIICEPCAILLTHNAGIRIYFLDIVSIVTDCARGKTT